jgi:dipeptidase E
VNLLLLSNSINAGSSYLEHARTAIWELAAGRRVVFVPFALDSWDDYTEQVRRSLPDVDVVGAHEEGLADQTILDAEVVFVGGGNTFRLLNTLERLDLVGALAERVREEQCCYIGSSAGTNIACPTIRTTNDMPIVQVRSFDALNLVPFQINPHFTDTQPHGLMAETRRERITQFHERSSTAVLGLREGAWLRVDGEERTLGGSGGGVIFTPDGSRELSSGASIEEWWRPPVFDDRAPVLMNRHHLRNAGPRSI